MKPLRDLPPLYGGVSQKYKEYWLTWGLRQNLTTCVSIYFQRGIDMGVYYYLVNHSKKEYLEHDGHVKRGQILLNDFVCKALVEYMFEHTGDDLMFVGDGAYFQKEIQFNYKHMCLKTKTETKYDD